jgi:uncharacterized protein (TIGR02757 family)
MKSPHEVPALDREPLDALYARYNRRSFVHPDPLEFLYRYDDVRDREVAGFVASSLAYGRVAQILRSVAAVLDRMTSSPARYLERTPPSRLRRMFADFKHRFTSGADFTLMLSGVRCMMKRHGSMEAAFVAHFDPAHETVLPALGAFVAELTTLAGSELAHLVPRPERGSACKRLNLFLRWMVRRDEVDPGGWLKVAPAKLVVPVDTHMHRICRSLGMTCRNQANVHAALEATKAFRGLAPEDPVKYDFALTRLGIRADGDVGVFLRECGAEEAA